MVSAVSSTSALFSYISQRFPFLRLNVLSFALKHFYLVDYCSAPERRASWRDARGSNDYPGRRGGR